MRADLAKRLAEFLRLALDQLPAPLPDAVHWQPHFAGDVDLWFDRTEPQVVTNLAHGTSKFVWRDKHPGYARLIPSKWAANSGAKQALAGHPGHAALLARPNTLSYGISRGGALVYWPGTAHEEVYPILAVTQWFEETGEFWGVGGGFLFEREGDRLTLATGYFYARWLGFLERNCALALAHGGALPIHVRLGVSDLRGSWWPLGRFDFNDEGHAAVEDSYEYDATLTSIESGELQRVAAEAFNGVAEAYGIEPFTHEQILKESRL